MPLLPNVEAQDEHEGDRLQVGVAVHLRCSQPRPAHLLQPLRETFPVAYTI